MSRDNQLETIDAFLACRRVALVGVSTRADDFSRVVWRALIASGHEVIPVHPTAVEVDGRKVFAHVGDVPVAPEAALIMTPASASAEVVRECVRAGVKRLWLHKGAGPGAVSEEAVREARASGLPFVAGECPMMFLPDLERVHDAHARWRQLTGAYPRHAALAPSPWLVRWGPVALMGALAWGVSAGVIAQVGARLSAAASPWVQAGIAAVVVFGLASLYFRGVQRPRRGHRHPRFVAHPSALAAAAAMVGVMLVLEALVAGWTYLRGVPIVASGVGSWRGFALSLVAAAIAGTLAMPAAHHVRRLPMAHP